MKGNFLAFKRIMSLYPKSLLLLLCEGLTNGPSTRTIFSLCFRSLDQSRSRIEGCQPSGGYMIGQPNRSTSLRLFV